MLSNNTFKDNGPVYARLERLISPYNYLQKNRSLSFMNDYYRSSCEDELEWFYNCQYEAIDFNGGEQGLFLIDLPKVQGAVYIEILNQ